MKKLFFLSITFCCAAFCYSQDVMSTDSLHTMLRLAKTDSAKIWAMHDLSYNYLYSNADSSMWYAQKALGLSKKTGYTRGEIRSLNDVGNVLANTSNFNGALQSLFEALQKAEQSGDSQMKSTSLGNISETYMNQGDYRHAINYTFSSLAIDLANHDTLYLIYDYMNLGDYFEKNNQRDSALIYENQAYQLNLQTKRTDLMEGILNALGSIQARLGNDNIALAYYKKSLDVNEYTHNMTDLSRTCLGIAKLNQRDGKRDSALFYLKQAYAAGQKASYQDGMLKASTLLASLYEQNNNDSTLKYLKLSVAIKDSIFSQEKIKQVQNLTFSEKIRQQQLEDLKLRQEEDRKNNLQFAGIAAFIPVFFGVVLLLSRRKTNPATIEFMSVLGLLLFFEFISLLIHPYITKWTHHIPVFMLLILVSVASILVPAHHKLQKWVNKKLTHKNTTQPVSKIIAAE